MAVPNLCVIEFYVDAVETLPIAADFVFPTATASASAAASQGVTIQVHDADAAPAPALLVPFVLSTLATVAMRLRRVVRLDVESGRSMLSQGVSRGPGDARRLHATCSWVQTNGNEDVLIHAQGALQQTLADAVRTSVCIPLRTLSGVHIADAHCSLCVSYLPPAAARHMEHQLRIEAALHQHLLHGSVGDAAAVQEALRSPDAAATATAETPSAATPPLPPTAAQRPALDAIVGNMQPPPLFFHNAPAPSMVILPPAAVQDSASATPDAASSSAVPEPPTIVHAEPAVDGVARVDALLCDLIHRLFEAGAPPPRTAFSAEAIRLAKALGHTASSGGLDAPTNELESLLPRTFHALRNVRPDRPASPARPTSSPGRPHDVQRELSPRADRDALPPRIPEPIPMDSGPMASVATASTASVTGVRLSRALRIKIAAVEEQRRAERVAAARNSSARARWSGDAAAAHMTAASAGASSSRSTEAELASRSRLDAASLRSRLLLPRTDGSSGAVAAAGVSPRDYQTLRDAQRAVGMSPRTTGAGSSRLDSASPPPPPPPPPELPTSTAASVEAHVPRAPTDSPPSASPRRRVSGWEGREPVTASPRAALQALIVNESTISSAGSGDGRVNDSGGAKLSEPSLTGMDMQISAIGASSTLDHDVMFAGNVSENAELTAPPEISAVTDGTYRSRSGDSMGSLSVTDADGTRSGDAWGGAREEELGSTVRLPAGVVTLRRDASASGSLDLGGTLSGSSSLAGIRLVADATTSGASALSGTIGLSESM